MSTYFLSFGSNDGPRRDNILQAFGPLSQHVSIIARSEIYETPAIGGGHPYMNCVAKVETALGVEALNAVLKDIEARAGRDAAARREHRVPLDIDIVVADGRVVRPADFQRSFFSIGYSRIL